MSTLIHQLHSPPGARRVQRKRVGRGSGSGHGKTSTMGHKGQKARAGRGKPRQGFEGGQNSMLRRLPKFGFSNRNRIEFQTVSLRRLAGVEASGPITTALLKAQNIVSSIRKPVKVLHSPGMTLTKKLTLQLQAISESARKTLEAAGGSFQETKI